MNCSEDFYHLVDSDGKYVLKAGEIARENTMYDFSDLTFESGPKEVCTDAHDDSWDGHNFSNPLLRDYKFEKDVFYRYVEAEMFKKCTLPNQKSSFYIATCSPGLDKFGFCEDTSTAAYNQLYLDANQFSRTFKRKIFEDGTIQKNSYSKGVTKFTEKKGSKDGYFYLASDDSPEKYLQWNNYGQANMERVQKKMNELKESKEENSKQYAELKILLKQFQHTIIKEEGRHWKPKGLETLFLGHELMKTQFRFEKALSLSKPEICKPTEKTRPRHGKYD
jgi:hypothetical protein